MRLNARLNLNVLCCWWLLTACIAEPATDPAGGDAQSADASVEVSGQSQALILPLPSCSAPTRNCGCGKYPLCIGGNWLCMDKLELCNGLDDDCDGEVDEGGSLCSDGRECTNDICATRLDGSKGCLNVPRTNMCSDGASCTDNLCLAPGAALPTGFSTPDARGCSARPIATRCDDGCHCTGAETCNPTAAGVTFSQPGTGCMAGRTTCERDGQFCTMEACCETGANCRAIEGSRAAIDLTCAVTTGDTRTSDTGVALLCPTRAGQPVTASLPCDDGNPCTANLCDETANRCAAAPINGDAPGCSGVTDEGCTRLTCVNGACTPKERHTGSDGLPFTCTGLDADTCWFKSCVPDRNRPGAGSCNRTAVDSVCTVASSYCITEKCTHLSDPLLPYFQVAGKPRGCLGGPNSCDDRDGCTTDYCHESTRLCSHQDSCSGPD